MTRYTPERLSELAKYASLQFSEEETAVLLGYHSATAITGNRAASAAFRKARLHGQAKVRALALQAAADGDAQGRRQFLELARQFDRRAAASDTCAACAEVAAHLRPALEAIGQVTPSNPVELARLAADALERLMPEGKA